MDDHSRTIVHIDIDCFYAQVEMIKQPILRGQPLGIQQKSIVVTSNYVAREYGIKKCMPISEAKKLCPNLILVNGEDLYDYRHASNKVSELLREYSDLVERLGLDENFIDVTVLVNKKLGGNNGKSVGCSFGDTNSLLCECGCMERICIGSQIAQEMRDQIFNELQLTTCAGIAHNKLLAKIAGTKNKPNKQTFLFPNSASELMLSLENVKCIPWIGQESVALLRKINIYKVEDLQNCDSVQIKNMFESDKAQKLLNLSFGIDNAPVKPSGKPQSIGLEDACKALTADKDVKQKFQELLSRLLILVEEDGRIPKVLKITVRKFDQSHPLGGIRETRQCSINIPLNNEGQLISVAMSLFQKLVDINKTYKITLLGLSFSKFFYKPNHKNTLASFLSKNVLDSVVDKCAPSVEQPLDLLCKSDTGSIFESPLKRAKFSDNAHFIDCPTTSSKQIKTSLAEISTNLASESAPEVQCPPGVDKDVFRELPSDMQLELWNDFKNKKDRLNQIQIQRSRKPKTNTLFKYMVRRQNNLN